MAEQARPTATVFVGGLDQQVNQQILHDAFLPFGDIVDISLPKPDLPSNKDPHRGFGYVEFSTAADAREAIDNMDQSELYGRVLKVSQAKPQKEAGQGLNSRTAVWEQDGYAAKYGANDEEQPQDETSTSPLAALGGYDEAGPRPE